VKRSDLVCKIDDILSYCNKCEKRKEKREKRKELILQYGSRFAQIDGYCNRKCPAGAELQSLGKLLPVRERSVVYE
jgi:hypothetical protein